MRIQNRYCLIACAAISCLLLLQTEAAAQSRGALIVNGPQRVAGQPRVLVQVDGNDYSEQAYGRPMPMPTGKRIIYGLALDENERQALAKWEQIIYVHEGRTTEVSVPPAIREPSGGMIGGGVVISSLGLLSTIGAGFLFTLADAAGTDCHDDGWARDACGLDPAPFVGSGVTTLLFGMAGLIGGPILIAEGASPKTSFYTPEIALGPGFFRVRF